MIGKPALRRLAPALSEAVAYRRLLAVANLEDLVLDNLTDAIDAHHVSRAKSLVRRLDKLDKVFNSREGARADRLGQALLELVSE